MRIALVSLHTDPYAPLGSGEAGGMNVVVSAVACRIAALGHDVEVLTRRDDPGLPETREVCDGVTLRRLPAGPPTPLPKHEIDQYCDEFSRAMAELPPYDVVHSHHWMSGVAALPVARRWGVPHLFSYHSVAAPLGADLAAGEPTESPDRLPGEAMLARESDVVVAVSRTEADMIEAIGADRARIVIVPPGVDAELFRPLEAAEQPSLERPYVLMAARLQPLKGPDLAIAAVGTLPPAERPLLVLAGGASSDHADYLAQLQRQVADADLGGDVLAIGAADRDRFATIMRGAQAVLVPSYTETFGLVALEGAASGVPVIASAAGGLREIVVDGETGYLMPTRDPEAWAAAIRCIMADGALRARLGTAARKRAETMTWDDMARRLSDLYLQVAR